MSNRKLTSEVTLRARTPEEIPEVAKVLIKAKGLIADKRDWCQGIMLLDNNRRCAMGALYQASDTNPFVTNEGAGGAYWVLAHAAEELFGFIEPASVNDKLGHEAVMQMYDLAISRALQGAES